MLAGDGKIKDPEDEVGIACALRITYSSASTKRPTGTLKIIANCIFDRTRRLYMWQVPGASLKLKVSSFKSYRLRSMTIDDNP